MGVFLRGLLVCIFHLCLPHARGGVSAKSSDSFAILSSSPRPWGCFFQLLTVRWIIHVFPTPVGVFLKARKFVVCRCGLPHARGGVSQFVCFSSILLMSSPRPWGCFLLSRTDQGVCNVFPTPVGVFP